MSDVKLKERALQYLRSEHQGSNEARARIATNLVRDLVQEIEQLETELAQRAGYVWSNSSCH